jgi:hypothetical protein
MVIHVIVIKILIETVYWNWVSQFFGALCILSYYAMCFVMNLHFFAPMIQPEINGEFLHMFSNGTAMVILFLLPFIAVLPDILILSVQKIFLPTPTDVVMLKQ